MLPEKSRVYCIDLYLFYVSVCTSTSSLFSFVCRPYQVFAVRRTHINSCLLLQLILAGTKEYAGVALQTHRRGQVLFISPPFETPRKMLAWAKWKKKLRISVDQLSLASGCFCGWPQKQKRFFFFYQFSCWLWHTAFCTCNIFGGGSCCGKIKWKKKSIISLWLCRLKVSYANWLCMFDSIYSLIGPPALKCDWPVTVLGMFPVKVAVHDPHGASLALQAVSLRQTHSCKL